MRSASRQARFEREILPHLDAANNLARWILRGSDDAQDVTQDAILRALRYFDSFHGDNAKAWLLKIVRNTCYSWIKARPKNESISAGEVGDLNPEHKLALEVAGHSEPAPDARLIEEADRQLINEGMQALPTHYREILILREIEELSYRDISEIVDIPIGTVMSRLSRARAALLQWVSGRLAESRGAMR